MKSHVDKQRFRCSALMIAYLFASTVMSSAVLAEQPATEKAVWKVQDIHFQYLGFTTQYSCDGLRDQMRSVMVQLGLQQTSVVNVSACTEISGPTRNPGVRIIVAYPVAATADAMQAIAADTKRSDLIALLQCRSKQPVNITAEPFDAERTIVVLSTKEKSTTSAAGNCELLEQVRDRLIKPIGAVVLKDGLSCTPYQATVGAQRLTTELLMAKSTS